MRSSVSPAGLQGFVRAILSRIKLTGSGKLTQLAELQPDLILFSISFNITVCTKVRIYNPDKGAQ